MPVADGRRARQQARPAERVVDASVAAKWFLSEADSDLAIALLDGGVRLVAPSLIRTEVIGAILRACRNDQIDEAEARAALAAWEHILHDGLVSLVPAGEVLTRAIDLAFAIRHPLHDCLYLALATTRRVRLITAGGPLHKRASGSASIELLSDRRVGRA